MPLIVAIVVPVAAGLLLLAGLLWYLLRSSRRRQAAAADVASAAGTVKDLEMASRWQQDTDTDYHRDVKAGTGSRVCTCPGAAAACSSAQY